MIAGVVKDHLVRIADFSNVFPMGGADTEGFEEVSPAGWKVFIENQFHDARSS